MEIHVVKVDWQTQQEKLRSIRDTVFIQEQQVPRDVEWDGADEDSTHFLAINTAGVAIGCARMLPTGQIGRMAVLKKHRGQRIGNKLLQAAVAEAQAQGMERVFLHAQTYAEDFYRKGGFIAFGDTFEEAGIEHVSMEMMLPLPFEPTPVAAAPAVRTQEVRAPLRKSSGPVAMHGASEVIEGLSQVIGSAVRKVSILSPHLDHDLFDNDQVLAKLSALARSAGRVEIRILIFSSKLMIDRGHRLLELARRLDEKISIQLLSENLTSETSTFVCADLDAYWLLPAYDKLEGVYDLGNPVTNQRLGDVFQTAWDKSAADPELRTLRL